MSWILKLFYANNYGFREQVIRKRCCFEFFFSQYRARPDGYQPQNFNHTWYVASLSMGDYEPYPKLRHRHKMAAVVWGRL